MEPLAVGVQPATTDSLKVLAAEKSIDPVATLKFSLVEIVVPSSDSPELPSDDTVANFGMALSVPETPPPPPNPAQFHTPPTLCAQAPEPPVMQKVAICASDTQIRVPLGALIPLSAAAVVGPNWMPNLNWLVELKIF